MTSFISAVSLLVLVLATGCFTLPIFEEHLSSSTFSSLNNDFTTSHNMEVTSDYATTEFPHLVAERTFNGELNFQTSTSVNKVEVEEHSSLSPRMFNELSTSEPREFTTQSSLFDLKHKQREFEDLSATTAEPEDDGNDMNKREFQVELTTNYMPSFTSSSSDVSPRLYTSESSTRGSTSTSTEKYTGLLKGDTPREEEEEESKSDEDIKKTKPESEDKSEEDTKTKKPKLQTEQIPKDPNMRTAQLFRDAPYNGPSYPSNVMILEKSTDVVTALPDKLTKPIKKDDEEHEHEDEHKSKKPLNQGEKSSLAEKKEQDS